jgi:hypothetical protein
MRPESALISGKGRFALFPSPYTEKDRILPPAGARSRFMLSARVANDYSAFTRRIPLIMNCRNPVACFIIRKSGLIP